MLVIYLTFLGVVTTATIFLAPVLVDEGKKLVADAPKFVERVKKDWLPQIDGVLERVFGRGLVGAADKAPAGSGDAKTEAVKPAAAAEKDKPPSKAAPAGAIVAVARREDGTCALVLGADDLHIQRIGRDRYRLSLAKASPTREKGAVDGKKLLATRFQSFIEGLGDVVAGVANVGITAVTNIVGALAAILLVLVVAAFLSIDLERVRGFFRSLVPPSYRDDYARLLHHLGKGLSGVVHGQLIICLINRTLAGLGF